MEALFEHVRKGDLGYIKQPGEQKLLTQYMLHSTDEDQRTLLHNAVTSGNAELVEYLLIQGASATVGQQDEEGWSPLHSASSCGFDRIVELLLTNGADVHSETTSKRTPLHYAASKGHGSLMRLLLKHGALVNAQDSVGFTPLHRAAASGKLHAVRILIDEASSTIDIQDKYKKTALAVAVESRHDSVVLFLAGRGASLNVALEDGKSIKQVSEKLNHAIQEIVAERVDVDELLLG